MVIPLSIFQKEVLSSAILSGLHNSNFSDDEKEFINDFLDVIDQEHFRLSVEFNEVEDEEKREKEATAGANSDPEARELP